MSCFNGRQFGAPSPADGQFGELFPSGAQGQYGTDPLMRGNYTVSASSSPFLADGTMFDVSGATADFEVVGDSDSAEGQGSATIGLTPLEPESMSAELITEAANKLASLGCDANALNGYMSAANAKLQEYLDAKAAEEAAAAAAQAAGEAAARRHEW